MRTLFLLLLSCLPCLAQFGVEQPMFALTSRSTSGCNFDPNSIAGIQFWLAADYGVTNPGPVYPPVDGTKVISWADKSTNNYWFTNYNDTAGPVYHASQTPNGLPAIITDFANSRLVGKIPVVLNQPNTVFLVFKTPPGLGGNILITSTNESSGTLVNRVSLNNIGGEKISMYAGTTLTGGSVDASVWYISSAVFNGASSQVKTNGVLTVSGDAGSGNMNGVTLMANANGSNPYNNPFAEVILYNALLSSNQIWNVENYLACKYNITNSVLTGL